MSNSGLGNNFVPESLYMAISRNWLDSLLSEEPKLEKGGILKRMPFSNFGYSMPSGYLVHPISLCLRKNNVSIWYGEFRGKYKDINKWKMSKRSF